MKVIISVACILLACQLAAAASVPQVFQGESTECAVALVDRVKASAFQYGAQVQARVTGLKETYDACRVLPERDAVACLRAFARYAITVVQGFQPELEAKKIVLRNYALERLEDYHVCRNGPESVFAPPRLCALRTYEDALEQLKPLTDAALVRFDVLRERFLTCLETPEDLQATCLVTLFRQATTIGLEVYAELQSLRPVFIEKSLEILEAYNTCRLA